MLHDESGSIGLTVGLMSTALLGVTGLTIDVGDWYMTKRSMQEAADAAAIGGATQLWAGGTNSQAISAATNDAKLNGFSPANGATVTVTVSGQSVTATIQKTADLMLSALFLKTAPGIKVSAQAGLVSGGPAACLLTTSANASGALTLNGSGSVSAGGCAVVTNSTSATGLSVTGTETLTTEKLCGPGGSSIGSSATVNPLPSNCNALQDPLANLTPPSNVNDPCQYNNASYSGDSTLSPGVYCGGITVSGHPTISFQPGVYILRNGPLKAAGTATLNGTGVGFYLTGTGTVVQLAKDDLTLSGNVTVNLSAPTSGPLAGIAFYEDHSAPTGDVNSTINGNTSVNIDGVLYFGNQDLTINGTNNGGDIVQFSAIVGNTVTMNGSNVFKMGQRTVPLPSSLSLPRVALTQ
jgi:Flp pilus assembly protein TadG